MNRYIPMEATLKNSKMIAESVPIEESYEKTNNHISVVERYYTPRYCLNVLEPGDDYCVLLHSNRICVITLAPSHNLLKSENVISSVSFHISEEILNKVSGKKKRGAHRIQPSSSILTVNCPGKKYTLCGCISGKLLEVNKQLINNPKYLISDPQGKGYLAIILPVFSVFDHARDNFVTPEQYESSVIV
ncbi:protein Abitram [Rhodnius prolixus]|uniref:protein Abitram n=1 Tax=Rhodnius prolixus TaxID=13249 RepID=UPI003D18B76E